MRRTRSPSRWKRFTGENGRVDNGGAAHRARDYRHALRPGPERWAYAAAAAALLAAACAGCGPPPASAPRPAAPAPAAVSPSPRTADPASVQADELASVPVLMYHQLVAHPRGVYDQTPAQFRAEVTALYVHGYRTVTAADLVSGRIDLPAGRKPVVLSFDDATTSQYAELPDGSVDPRSAIGILLAVGRAHGQAHPVATLYVNERPFAGHDAYLASLTALGIEVGAHTLTHADLGRLSDGAVQSELAGGLGVITRAVPGLPVTTMALPFGVHPRNRVLASKGGTGKASYRFAGVFLVGSNPAASPYSRRFDALEVPRIRSGLRTGDQTFTSTYWLPRMFSGQVASFVSDGDPQTVAFPKAKRSLLAPRFAARAHAY